MELKIVTPDVETQGLTLPRIDRQQQELNAWKSLAMARGVMLDPLNFPGSRSYAVARMEALEAIKVLKSLSRS